MSNNINCHIWSCWDR